MDDESEQNPNEVRIHCIGLVVGFQVARRKAVLVRQHESAFVFLCLPSPVSFFWCAACICNTLDVWLEKARNCVHVSMGLQTPRVA
jgi:hypothetical protein